MKHRMKIADLFHREKKTSVAIVGKEDMPAPVMVQKSVEIRRLPWVEMFPDWVQHETGMFPKRYVRFQSVESVWRSLHVYRARVRAMPMRRVTRRFYARKIRRKREIR